MRIRVPTWHDGQVRLLAERRRFNAACLGRRFGKTALGTWEFAEPALGGKPAAWFAPTYKLLEEVWSRVSTTLAPVTRKRSEQQKRLELVTGGVLDFWTLEVPDPARGRAYARVVIDEAAMAPLLRRHWEEAIRPTLSDYQGDAWFFTTPKPAGLHDGARFFREIFARGEGDDPEWKSWQMPSSTNPHIAREEIEAARRDLPDDVFRQEYMAEFVDFDGGAIYRAELQKLLDGGRACSIPYDQANDTILAMDLGIGDHTSLVLGQWIGHERRVLHAYESFGVPLSHYIDHLKRSEYRIDRIILPHDGNSLSLQTGRTPRDLLETAFPRADIQVLPRTPDIEQDINHVRERFGSVWIDKSGASLLIEALKKYRRRKNDRTGLFEKPLHDSYSDMADAFRYWMQAEERRPGGHVDTQYHYSEAW